MPRSKYMSDDITAASSKSVDLSGNMRKLLCSYGGKILPRPYDGQLRYVGGDTRLVTVDKSMTFQDFKKKLEDVFETMSLIIKYQLPTLELDILISVTCDEDLQNMMEEYDRYDIHKESFTHPRVRAFLFPPKPAVPSIENKLSLKQRYVNAVNGLAPISVKQKVSSSALLKVPDYITDPECSGLTEIESQSRPWMNDLPLTSCPCSFYQQNMRRVPSEGAVLNSLSKMGTKVHRVHSSPNLIRHYQTHIVPNRQVPMGHNYLGRSATVYRGGSPSEGSPQLATHGRSSTRMPDQC